MWIVVVQMKNKTVRFLEDAKSGAVGSREAHAHKFPTAEEAGNAGSKLARTSARWVESCFVRRTK